MCLLGGDARKDIMSSFFFAVALNPTWFLLLVPILLDDVVSVKDMKAVIIKDGKWAVVLFYGKEFLNSLVVN